MLTVIAKKLWVARNVVEMLLVVQEQQRFPRRKELKGAIQTVELSIELQDITVRLVHAGGREELYQSAVPASRLIDKYPGMCVAHPSIFRKPYESLVPAEEQLLPGKKYYIVPYTTVQKLKHRHSIKRKAEERKNNKEPWSDKEDYSDDYIYTAKDFYLSKERPSRYLPNRSQKSKKPFVPPN